MNATVPAENRPRNVPALVAGGSVAALIPHSLEEAFRVSTAIAQSGLAPKGLDRQEQILVAIMAGAELGLAPFQALQSFAVVNGRPTLWGDGLMAVARAGGVRVKEWIEGDGEGAVAHCEVTRPEGEVIARSFSVTQAKKAGLWGKQGPWQAYPTRMLGMRARAYALRDGCADMLRGFQVREEVEDYEVVRDVSPPKGTGMRARLEARQAQAEPNGGFDPAHVEAELAAGEFSEAEFVDPPAPEEPVAREVEAAEPEPAMAAEDERVAQLDLADAGFDPMDWAASFARGLSGLETVAEVSEAWSKAKAQGFVVKLRAKSEAAARQLADAVNERCAEIKKAAA